MRIAWTTLVALVAAASAAGQTPSSPALAQIRSSEAQDIQQDVASRPSFAKDIDYIALVAREEGLLLRALQTYAEERSDKQVGATASASGAAARLGGYGPGHSDNWADRFPWIVHAALKNRGGDK